MGRRFRRLGSRSAVLALLAFLVVLSAWAFGLSGLRSGAPSPAPAPLDAPGAPGADQAAEDAGPSDSEPPRTQASTVLIFEVDPARCDRVPTWSEPAGAARAGLTADGLEAALPGWRVVEFAPERVRLVQSRAEGCPEPARLLTLTIRDGLVVILEGRGKEGEVYRRTDIRADDLLPGDRAVLENGVTVEGEERAWQYLEGITSHTGP